MKMIKNWAVEQGSIIYTVEHNTKQSRCGTISGQLMSFQPIFMTDLRFKIFYEYFKYFIHYLKKSIKYDKLKYELIGT